MKQMVKILKQGCVILLVMLSTQSCNSWLDVYPENLQSADNFWTSKEEVQEVLMGTYTELRNNNMDRFIQWGEVRGDGLVLMSTTSNEAKIKDLNLLTVSNPICDWTAVYSVIARANTVIKYGPSVLDKDVTMTQALSDSYVGEAIFLRSLCYFYLLRTFGDVPLILDPYDDDTQSFYTPVSKKEDILKQLIADLTQWSDKCKPGYEVSWQTKGRATSYASYALLADIHLWVGNYEEVLKTCNKIPESKYSLMSKNEWFSLYYPGNSRESIFELQWSYVFNQTNLLSSLFYIDYRISIPSRNLFEDGVTETDIRAAGGSYLIVGPSTDAENRIWKYTGTDIYGLGGEVRSSSQYDNNWIFYRYSEIILMKAEAYVMLGDYTAGYTLLNQIRARAGYAIPLSIAESKKECLIDVIDERQREFLAEGKRWFDILRVGTRNNFEYSDYLTDVLLAPIPAKDRPLWESKLSDTNSFYLPILKSEIEKSNGVLVQNPFYAGQD